MKTWLINFWGRIRTSFWFTPSLYIVGAIALAVAALLFDSHYPVDDWKADQWRNARWLTVTDSAARVTLGTLVGALFTVTGIVFSLTMLLLSQTTSQYGPRLVRTFMQHTVPQATLGIFLGTSVFGMIVLRSVREPTDSDPGFVPNIAVLLGELGGGVCLVVLIAFLQFVSQSIRAETVVKSVYNDLRSAIERLYPTDSVRSFTPQENVNSHHPSLGDNVHCSDDSAFPVAIVADQDGYLQDIDLDNLLLQVHAASAQMRLLVTPGDYVVHGDVLAHSTVPSLASGTDAVSITEFTCKLAKQFYYGSRRTPRQDVGCAVSELAEVAVRALSPGINDPTTAIACIDYLAAAMCYLLEHPTPASTLNDENGVPRIQVKPRTFEHLLAMALDQIRLYGKSDPKVTDRISLMLDRIEKRCKTSEERDAINAQRSRLQQTVQEVNGDAKRNHD